MGAPRPTTSRLRSPQRVDDHNFGPPFRSKPRRQHLAILRLLESRDLIPANGSAAADNIPAAVASTGGRSQFWPTFQIETSPATSSDTTTIGIAGSDPGQWERRGRQHPGCGRLNGWTITILAHLSDLNLAGNI